MPCERAISVVGVRALTGEVALYARPLRVGRSAGSLDVSWDAVSCGSGDYDLIYGGLDQVGAYVLDGAECSVGAGSFAWATPPAGTIWFLIVGSDGASTESSWGNASAGERNGLQPSGFCGNTSKNVVATCE